MVERVASSRIRNLGKQFRRVVLCGEAEWPKTPVCLKTHEVQRVLGPGVIVSSLGSQMGCRVGPGTNRIETTLFNLSGTCRRVVRDAY
jgi:hypothetical protein